MGNAKIAPEKRKPGRPPNALLRQKVLDVAFKIISEEGLGRLTMDRVAGEAGVGKPTLYRSWANALELAMAAFMHGPQMRFKQPGVSAVRPALAGHVTNVARAFATPRGRQITLTMASADPQSELSKAFRNQVILKSREIGRGILDAGLAAGEFAPEIQVDVVLDMIYGPLFYRLLTGHMPLHDEFGQEIVDTIFSGIQASKVRAG